MTLWHCNTIVAPTMTCRGHFILLYIPEPQSVVFALNLYGCRLLHYVWETHFSITLYRAGQMHISANELLRTNDSNIINDYVAFVWGTIHKLQYKTITLQWRHNGPDSVSNHQPHDCLLNRLFKAQIKENIKAPRHWPLWREFAGERWIPRTKGQ